MICVCVFVRACVCVWDRDLYRTYGGQSFGTRTPIYPKEDTQEESQAAKLAGHV